MKSRARIWVEERYQMSSIRLSKAVWRCPPHSVWIFLKNIQNLIWKKTENDSFWGGKPVHHSGTKTLNISLESSQKSTQHTLISIWFPGGAYIFLENAQAPTRFLESFLGPRTCWESPVHENGVVIPRSFSGQDLSIYQIVVVVVSLLIQLNPRAQKVSGPWREPHRRYKSELRSTKHESPHRTIDRAR